MFCTIGSLWKGAKVQVYASDILANEYNRILKEKGIKPVVPVTREDMESLSYANDFFDIVYCVNALDHAVNPIGAIQEMYRVVKPGGWIYLKCFVNVGEKENYVGMHMWNVKLDGNNNLIIWNKEKSFSVNELFPGFKSSKEVQPGHEDDEMIISTLQK
jgi:SAM-dependent methyltransferase